MFVDDCGSDGNGWLNVAAAPDIVRTAIVELLDRGWAIPFHIPFLAPSEGERPVVMVLATTPG